MEEDIDSISVKKLCGAMAIESKTQEENPISVSLALYTAHNLSAANRVNTGLQCEVCSSWLTSGILLYSGYSSFLDPVLI